MIIRNGIRLYNLKEGSQTILVLQNNTDTGFYFDSEGNEIKLGENGYTVYADIDGANGPSELWKDVYPFYITMDGKVIPAYDKSANPDGSGGDSTKHLMVSVLNETIKGNKRIVEWLSKSARFLDGACQSGYVGRSTPLLFEFFYIFSCLF